MLFDHPVRELPREIVHVNPNFRSPRKFFFQVAREGEGRGYSRFVVIIVGGGGSEVGIDEGVDSEEEEDGED